MPKVRIHLDFETYSECDLKACGAYRYARDPSTDALCAAYRVGDEEIGLWLPHHRYPFDDIDPRNIVVLAWNAQFERQIWNEVMVRRYGWPRLKLEQFVCVAAWARVTAASPAKLEVAAQFFGQKAQKDMCGHQLMMKMCKPAMEAQQLKWLHGAVDRLGRNVDHEEAKRCHHTKEDLLRLGSYCKDDLRAEEQIAAILPELPGADLEAFWETEHINDRGLIVDLDFAEAAVDYAELEKTELAEELFDVTDGAVETPRQFARFKDWCLPRLSAEAEEITVWYDKGVRKNSFDADTRANLLAEDDMRPGFLPRRVREALEILDEAGKSTIAKYQAIIDRAIEDADGNWRVHGLYIFAGASQTGRKSSVGVQVHNLVRDVPKEAPRLIAAFKNGDKRMVDKAVAEWADAKNAKLPKPSKTSGVIRITPASPIHALAALVRPTFTAGRPKQGYSLVWGDWSSIEARALPWLSLDTRADDLLAIFRKGGDVYLKTASDILGRTIAKEDEFERQAYGKVPVLSLGYGGGAGAFMAMAKNYGVRLDEGDVRGIVGDWRSANPWATKFWVKLEDAAMWAMKNPGPSFGAGRLAYRYDPDALGGLGALFCVLPSGRELCYPDPSIDVVRTPYGKDKLGITARKGSWRPKKGDEANWPRVTLWYGLLAENGTQATCADILYTAIDRAASPQWDMPVHGDTHDELMLESWRPEEDAELLKQLMETPPGWPGDDALPLAADVQFGPRYKVKADWKGPSDD